MDPTYFSLVEAVEKKDYSLIEREAHTLKGVAANLGLDSLRYASDGLVQAVRRKEYDEIQMCIRDSPWEAGESCTASPRSF